MKSWVLILLFSVILNSACNHRISKNELFTVKVVSEKASDFGNIHLELNGIGELSDIGFHPTKTSALINSFQAFRKNNQVLPIDITLNAEDKPSWIPFTELTKILNEIKGMAEEYNCKTIVYIHSDLIK